MGNDGLQGTGRRWCRRDLGSIVPGNEKSPVAERRVSTIVTVRKIHRVFSGPRALRVLIRKNRVIAEGDIFA